VRPHVTDPRDFYRPDRAASDVPDQVRVPIDPGNWETITDAIGRGRKSGRAGSVFASAGN